MASSVDPPTCGVSMSSSQISESVKTRNLKLEESRINLPKSDKDSPPRKVSIPTNAKSISGNCYTFIFLDMKLTSAIRRLLLS